MQREKYHKQRMERREKIQRYPGDNVKTGCEVHVKVEKPEDNKPRNKGSATKIEIGESTKAQAMHEPRKQCERE